MIYKPNFEDFLEEVQAPVYLQEVVEGGRSNPVRSVYIVASGYNREEHPLQYRTFIGELFAEGKEVREQSDAVIRDMRRQIANCNLTYYPGILSEKAVTCSPYVLSRPERPDISTLAKTDPDGNEIS